LLGKLKYKKYSIRRENGVGWYQGQCNQQFCYNFSHSSVIVIAELSIWDLVWNILILAPTVTTSIINNI
jgi:hypothetical protein